MDDAMILGIDVSHHQRMIDWSRVAQSGVRFCICRATYGTYKDRTFVEYYNAAKDAGIIPGAYHFFRLKNGQPATGQAQAFLDALRQAHVPSQTDDPFFIALDLEANEANGDPMIGITNRDNYIVGVDVWLDIVESEIGRPALIYTNRPFWRQLDDPMHLGDRPLWAARYNIKPPQIPPGWRAYTFWQYTGSGTVDGIQGDVDLNRFDGTEDAFNALARGGRNPDVPITDRPSKAETIKAIQTALNQYGVLPPLVVDGIAGPKTRAALRTVNL